MPTSDVMSCVPEKSMGCEVTCFDTVGRTGRHGVVSSVCDCVGVDGALMSSMCDETDNS